MGDFRSLWLMWCALAEHPLAPRLCMQRLMDAPFSCSVPIPQCLLSSAPLCAMQPKLLVLGKQSKASSVGPGSTPCSTSVKLPVVWVCSGMKLCFAIFLSIFVFLSILGSCLVFNISISASLWRYSAVSSPLPVPESTWHFLPQQKNRYGAEIKPAKAVPCSHGNICPDPYEIVHWSPAASCPKFKYREHNSKVPWCIDVTWNHLEQRSGMENLCLAQGRARGLLAIVYCCLFTCTQAYQNVFAGLLQLPSAAFNSSFGDLCQLSSSRQC